MVYRNLIKPILDFLMAIIAFLVLLPIFLVTAFLLFIITFENPFFLQKRPGKNGRIFSVIKFKTMRNTRDKSGHLLSDEMRMTPIGKFIRSTSIDEIPQLLNVIKGDMSIVGPRPLLPEYLPLYSEYQNQRHLVKPGITGYAQINGRNSLTWEEKFDFDVYYVKNCSFVLDLKIVLKTVKQVFARKNINKANDATMDRFRG